MRRLLVFLLLVVGLTAAPHAATRVEVPGGIYSDALPSGEFVVGFHSGGLRTHLGDVPKPTQEQTFLLFNRITNVGGFKIASKSQSSDQTYVWESGSWRDVGRISHGVEGHAFDDAGTLVIIIPGGDQESQGLRYYDPAAPAVCNWDVQGLTPGWVTGSPSYNSNTSCAQALGVTRLFAWTRLGDVAVGQGEDGGALIQYQGRHYLLESGDTQFIQFHRTGDQLAVAISKLREQSAVLHWLTVGEITSLPLYAADEPPVIVPPPPPTVDPPTQQVDDAAARRVVDQERAKFGDLNEQSQGQLMRNIAFALNAERVAGGPFGVLIKTSGSNCGGISCDIVCTGNGDAQRQWDVLVGDAAHSAVWHEVNGITRRECVVPDGSIVTPPPPIVTPPGGDIEVLKARLAIADARIQQLEQQAIGLQQEVADARTQQGIAEQEREAVQRELNEAKNDVLVWKGKYDTVTCSASIFGIRIGCRVNR